MHRKRREQCKLVTYGIMSMKVVMIRQEVKLLVIITGELTKSCSSGKGKFGKKLNKRRI